MWQRRFVPRAPDRHLKRQTLYWLLATLVVALALHGVRLPLWLLGFSGALVVWRLYLLVTAARVPSNWLKSALAVAATLIFVLTNGRSFTVETAIGFFVLTYGLKLLELHTPRDAFLFAFLSLFLLALVFLFGQDLASVMLVFAAFLVPLHALRTMHQGSRIALRGGRGLAGTGSLLLLALPLLLVFYVLFPRIGPFWSMPLKSRTAFTGLSETMAPGEIANLASSPDRAFRATFRESPPTASVLYWQAIILDQFDGVRWSRSVFQQERDSRITFAADDAVTDWRYEVLMDPHNQKWGFTLANHVVRVGAGLTADGLVRFAQDVKSARRYLQSEGAVLTRELDDRARWRFTRIPGEGNPRTRALVNDLRGGGLDDDALSRALLGFFPGADFRYSLQPPLLTSRDRIDEFLFVTRKGFCEHFASSMAYALRAAGIPSRVVTGYQGGEWNDQGNFLVIHQYDAHAWVEAWLDGRGWVRLDPTAAVAPNRIEAGIRDALATEGSFLQNDPLSLARFDHIDVVRWLRMQLEYSNFLWQDWVVNYDRERQFDLFSGWLGDDAMRRSGLLLAGMALAVFLVMSAVAFWPRLQEPRDSPAVRVLHRFKRRLVAAGLPEGNRTLAQMVAEAQCRWPREARALAAIAADLERLLYDPRSGDPRSLVETLRRVRRSVARLRLRDGMKAAG